MSNTGFKKTFKKQPLTSRNIILGHVCIGEVPEALSSKIVISTIPNAEKEYDSCNWKIQYTEKVYYMQEYDPKKAIKVS